jgi:hypothetical protein
MFNIAEKQIIVNSDEQIALLNGDPGIGTVGAAYTDGHVTAVGHAFVLEGFLHKNILVSDLVGGTITAQAAVAAVKQVATYTVTATAANVGDTFRLVFESVDYASVEYQNFPVSKIYQIGSGVALDSAANIAQAIKNAIDADQDSMCTVSIATAVLTFTVKETGIKMNLYVDPVLSDIAGTFAVTTPAAVGINTYDALKNIEWSKNLDFDRNQEWQPLKGVNYTKYTFSITSSGFVPEGNNVPNVPVPVSTTSFCMWVAPNAATFKAALDLLIADIAAI